MNPSEIKIVFTLEQVNAMLQRLGLLPYAQVADLIDAIKQVASPQVPREEPAEDETAQ